MARAPWTRGKTRLAGAARADALEALRWALFLDTLDVVTSTSVAVPIVACEPAHACERMREVVGSAAHVLAQRGGNLGERIEQVFSDVFALGAEIVVTIGSDLPDLPAGDVERTFRLLRRRKEQLVLGPATDGGYYLVGLNRPCPSIFHDIAWSTSRVFEQTRTAAAAAGLNVSVLPLRSDVDEPGDLERFAQPHLGSRASRTRRWALHHLTSPSASANDHGQQASR